MRQIVRGLTSVVLAMFVFYAMPFSTFAITAPNFPSCLNHEGNPRAYYSYGTHGIVGDPREFKGSDGVYSIDDDRVIQCFCPDTGDGIQTIWWKVSSLTQSQIDDLVRQGWHYVPFGDKWGLHSAPYVAKNSSFSCIGGKGGGSSEDGQVLGLATTGNLQEIIALAFIGITLLVAGRSLKKQS